MTTLPANSSVVLVEDDNLVAASISSVMRSRGISITACSSAEDFIKQFTTEPDGCLILDVDLGANRLSGLELLRWMRGQSWNVPVVLLSGKVTVPEAIEAVKESVVDVISKPPSVPRLIAAVEHSLAQKNHGNKQSSALLRTVLKSLSPTERSVLEMLLSGASNKVIASRLDLGLRSAVRYRKSLLDAFGYNTIPELANALGAAGISPADFPPLSLRGSCLPVQQRQELQAMIRVITMGLNEIESMDLSQLLAVAQNTRQELEQLGSHRYLTVPTDREKQNPPSALVVCDQFDMGSVLRDFIRANGFLSESCVHVSEAVGFLDDYQDSPPDFVLLQIKSPSEFQTLLERLGQSESPNRTKVIVLPGCGVPHSAEARWTVFDPPLDVQAVAQFMIDALNEG